MTMDAATEIKNFAASCCALAMIDDLPHADADKDAMIRDLASYGPAILHSNHDDKE